MEKQARCYGVEQQVVADGSYACDNAIEPGGMPLHVFANFDGLEERGNLPSSLDMLQRYKKRLVAEGQRGGKKRSFCPLVDFLATSLRTRTIL
jgi:hypothetical protein